MSAVKKFFEDARKRANYVPPKVDYEEIARREKAAQDEKERIHEEKVQGAIRDLKSGIFLDDFDIADYLNELEPDVFDTLYVRHQRDLSHDERIIEYLNNGFTIPLEVYNKLDFKIVDLTDDLWDKIKKNEKIVFNNRLEEAVANHKFPDRPLTDIDEQYDTLLMKIAEKKKKYPNSEILKKMEIDLEKLGKVIQNKNNVWTQDKRNEFIRNFTQMYEM
jgi:hypothetical protein